MSAACSLASPSLRESFAPHFAIGFGTERANDARSALLRHHAAAVTCENSLKPRALRPTPEPDAFAWDRADAWLAWVESLGAAPVGHTLVWSYMMPEWLLERARSGALTRDAALAWQDAHIRAVLARYGDRIRTWDVVNEALSDASSPDAYLRDDPWLNLVGEDGLVAAFRSARAAAPHAKLLYNDYNLEQSAKRARALRLLRRLEAEGLRPDAVGIQGHCTLSAPPAADFEAAILEFHAAGYPVHITELDVSIYDWAPGADIGAMMKRRYDPGTDLGHETLPPALQERLAARYRDLFAVFLRHADKLERVAFWNIDDGNTWLRNWPLPGRPNHPLLFDAQQRPKPAFHVVIGLLRANAIPAPAP
jgi:endo-1,4-beta-xylanase